MNFVECLLEVSGRFHDMIQAIVDLVRFLYYSISYYNIVCQTLANKVILHYMCRLLI